MFRRIFKALEWVGHWSNLWTLVGWVGYQTTFTAIALGVAGGAVTFFSSAVEGWSPTNVWIASVGVAALLALFAFLVSAAWYLIKNVPSAGSSTDVNESEQIGSIRIVDDGQVTKIVHTHGVKNVATDTDRLLGIVTVRCSLENYIGGPVDVAIETKELGLPTRCIRHVYENDRGYVALSVVLVPASKLPNRQPIDLNIDFKRGSAEPTITPEPSESAETKKILSHLPNVRVADCPATVALFEGNHLIPLLEAEQLTAWARPMGRGEPPPIKIPGGTWRDHVLHYYPKGANPNLRAQTFVKTKLRQESAYYDVFLNDAQLHALWPELELTSPEQHPIRITKHTEIVDRKDFSLNWSIKIENVASDYKTVRGLSFMIDAYWLAGESKQENIISRRFLIDSKTSADVAFGHPIVIPVAKRVTGRIVEEKEGLVYPTDFSVTVGPLEQIQNWAAHRDGGFVTIEKSAIFIVTVTSEGNPRKQIALNFEFPNRMDIGTVAGA